MDELDERLTAALQAKDLRRPGSARVPAASHESAMIRIAPWSLILILSVPFPLSVDGSASGEQSPERRLSLWGDGPQEPTYMRRETLR